MKMKKLVESWQKFLKEGETPFTDLEGNGKVSISKEQRTIASADEYKGFRPEKQREKPGYKPEGLWYACGDEWIEWTKSEMPEWLKEYKYLYEISITDRVLKIDTPEKFKDFESKYSASRNGDESGRYSEKFINWASVAKDYDGIEICPYMGQFRMGSSDWYYPWDVASGCIWSPGGIKDVKLIGTKNVE